MDLVQQVAATQEQQESLLDKVRRKLQEQTHVVTAGELHSNKRVWNSNGDLGLETFTFFVAPKNRSYDAYVLNNITHELFEGWPIMKAHQFRREDYGEPLQTGQTWNLSYGELILSERIGTLQTVMEARRYLLDAETAQRLGLTDEYYGEAQQTPLARTMKIAFLPSPELARFSHHYHASGLVSKKDRSQTCSWIDSTPDLEKLHEFQVYDAQALTWRLDSKQADKIHSGVFGNNLFHLIEVFCPKYNIIN